MTRAKGNGLDQMSVAIGELTATTKAIADRQAEEIGKSATHRQRVFDRLDGIDSTLGKNTTDISDMMPVFKRAQEAEQQRKVYKWQARGMLILIGGALTAAANYIIRQFG
jgi:hypothetical protein